MGTSIEAYVRKNSVKTNITKLRKDKHHKTP